MLLFIVDHGHVLGRDEGSKLCVANTPERVMEEGWLLRRVSGAGGRLAAGQSGGDPVSILRIPLAVVASRRGPRFTRYLRPESTAPCISSVKSIPHGPTVLTVLAKVRSRECGRLESSMSGWGSVAPPAFRVGNTCTQGGVWNRTEAPKTGPLTRVPVYAHHLSTLQRLLGSIAHPHLPAGRHT